MSVQSSMLAKPNSKPPTVAARMEEVVGVGFDVDRFVRHFTVLAEAAGGLKQLRSLVVGLALRGRILPLRNHPGGSSPPPPPGIEGVELPPLPPGWTWASLGSITKSGPKNGYSPKAVEYQTPVKSLTLTATTSGRFDGRFFKYIDEEIPPDSDFWLRDGDVLIQRGNTIEYVGVAAVYRGLPKTFIYPDLMMRVRLSDDVDVDFVHMALNGPRARDFMRSRASGTSGTMPKINQATLLSVPIPLPPHDEQKRIVAKVDLLTGLCDDLEARQTKKRETGNRLTKSALEALITAEGPDEFDAAWKRVVENFDVLVDRAEKVGDVKQGILALAVSGRLCTSKPGDGTAHAELPILLTSRRDQVGRDPVAPPSADLPSIPSAWCWASLDSLLVVLRNGVSTRPEGTEGVPVLRISAVRPNAVNMTEIRFLPGKPSDYDGAFIKEGDLLFTRYSGNAEFVGACGVVPKGANKVVHPDKLIRGEVVPGLVDPRFVSLAMSSGASRAYVDQCGQTTAGQIGISGKQLKAAPVPLPPLKEQKRIVAKVEQLMTVCDDLEAKLRRAEDRAAKLVEAVVAEMVP